MACLQSACRDLHQAKLSQTQALHGTQNMQHLRLQHCAMLDTAGCQASHRLPLL